MWLHIPQEALSASAPESEGSTSGPPSPAEWSLWCTSSGKPSLRPASWPGWKRRPWHRLLSGTTCSRSTLEHGAASWISLLAEHRARTFPSPESAGAWTVSAPASSSSTSALPSSAKPRSSSGRTLPAQLGLFPVSVSISKPEAIAGPGPSFARVTLAPLTSGPGSSSWPTPRGSDGSKGGPNQRGSAGDLMLPSSAVQWGKEHLWPTPSARDWKSGEHSEATERRNSRPLTESAWSWARSHLAALTSTGGPECLRYDPTSHRLSLNPAFVEGLMGWPEGWTLPYARTVCVHAATELFPSKPPTPGAASGTTSFPTDHAAQPEEP